jgi:hypothetical protein
MNLVESFPWQDSIVDAPPVKLEYRNLAVPAGVHLNFIGTAHNSANGLPDYLEEALEETDVFMMEFAGWEPARAKQLQHVARGDFKARQKILELNAIGQEDSGQAEWAESVYKALFGSRVRVALVDYPLRHHGLAAIARVHFESEPMTANTMPLIAARDKFILSNIVAELTRLRQDPKFNSKTEVRALALFGVGHFAIHDGFAASIAESGTTSTSRLLFEPGADFPARDAYGLSKASLAYSRERVVQYQNWVRTP